MSGRIRLSATACALLPVSLALLSAASAAPPVSHSKAKPPKKQVPKSGSDSQAVIEKGRSLFGTNCVVCHGASGIGDDGPALRKKGLASDYIARAIRKGFSNEMPAFDGKLKDAEISALAAYVRSLQK